MDYRDQLISWLGNIQHAVGEYRCEVVGDECPSNVMNCKECVFYSRDIVAEFIETLKGE